MSFVGLSYHRYRSSYATMCALEGREKGTGGLVGNIAGGRSDASRAPAGAQARWPDLIPVVSPPANLFRASGSVSPVFSHV